MSNSALDASTAGLTHDAPADVSEPVLIEARAAHGRGLAAAARALDLSRPSMRLDVG